MSYLRDRNDNKFNEFNDNNNSAGNEAKSGTDSPPNETNLYNRYKENAVNARFRQSSEGIPAISREDFDALNGCNRESFWYRCLPLSVGICGLMYFMAAKRNMKPKALHLASGVFGGWFVGKMSYRRTCEDRVIRSGSQSPFANALRRRRGFQTGGEEPVLTADGHNLESTDPFWDPQSKDSFGYGAHEFADYKDNELNPGGADRGSDESPTYTTYEDLRAKNRANQQKPQQFST